MPTRTRRSFAASPHASHARPAPRATTIAALTFASLGGLAIPCCAHAAMLMPDPPTPPTQVLWLETNQWDKFLVSPKDAGLKRALAMIPARAKELADEIPNQGGMNGGPPPEALELLGTLLTSPVRLSLSYNAENQGGFMGAGLALNIGGDAKSSERTAQIITSILKTTPLKPKPSKEFKGMSEILTPLGMIRLGTPEGAATGYHIKAGTVEGDAESVPDFGTMPAGFVAHTRARFAAAPLLPFLDFAEMLGNNDPNAAATIKRLRESGVFGGEGKPGITTTYVAGYTDDRSVSITTISGVASQAAIVGLSRTPLTDADLRVVPEDAHWGYVGRRDLSAAREQIALITQSPDAQRGLQEFQTATGVDLIGDVFNQLAGGYAFYLSDTTGGGGMYSSTLVLSLVDGKRLEGALQKASAKANEELAKPEGARGYIAARWWSDERAPGCSFMSISFPGLPVPAEITASVVADRLVLSLSPQGAIGAARQAAGLAGKGIRANPRIGEALSAADTASMVSFSFNDTSKTIREGYPLVSMIGNAAGNLVRSRHGSANPREPGMVTPTYAELLSASRAGVSWSSWRGDDYVSRSEGDRSVMVRVAAAAGKVAPFVPLIELAGFAAAMDDQKKKLMQQMHEHHEDHDENHKDMDAPEKPDDKAPQ